MRQTMFGVVLAAAAAAALPASAEASAVVGVACRGCTLLGGALERAQTSGPAIELEGRIDALNTEIRSMDTNWPIGYAVLAYAGYVVAPIAFLGGGTALVYGIIVALGRDAATLAAVLIAVGAGGVLLGLAGVAAIIYGVTRGSAISAAATKRRNELIDERIRLERDLERLKKGAPPAVGPAPQLIHVLAF